MPRAVLMTPAQLAAQELLETTQGRPLKVSKHIWLTRLYNNLREKHFPGMPACRIGIDYRPHYFVLGSYSAAEGIVLRNNPAVISGEENLIHILLHEMTHQWITWKCLVAGDKAIQDEDAEDGHSMSFRRKMREAMGAAFPGRDFPEAGLAKLRY